jgi:1,4-dihydroxy-2-naphthoyl-CoA synthase
MTLPMDIRIASTTARFGFVFSRLGLVPEGCSTWFLPRIVGISRALEWFESGRLFDANEALSSHLVSEVVDPVYLLAHARSIARKLIDRSSSVSIMATRRMTLQMLGADHPMRAHELESRAIAQMRDLPDFKEGLAAFLEKRDAQFPMKLNADRLIGFPWWKKNEFAPDA